MELLALTSGKIKIDTEFQGYELYKGDLEIKRKNFLISCEEGKITAYAMKDLEKFGEFYIKPG